MTSRNEKSCKTSHKSADKKRETEVANLAKRKKEFEGESDPKKLLRYNDWEQTATDVNITLFAGKKLSSNEIEVVYTQYDVVVALTDGRKWYCHLNRKIEETKCKVQLQKLRVLLKMKKLEPGITWKSLHFDPNEVEVVTSLNKPTPTKQTQKGSRHKPSSLKPTPPETTPLATDVDMSLSTTTKVSFDEKTEIIGDCSTSTVTNGVTEKGIDEAQQTKDSSQTDEVYDLDHIKHDFYERSTDSIVAMLFVKKINRETITVNFGTNDVCVLFKTSDAHFLLMHSGTDKDTVFQWKINLVDDIKPESCTFKVSDIQVSFIIVKVESRRWGALEASQARTASKSQPTIGEWQPVNVSPDPLDGVVMAPDPLDGVVMAPDPLDGVGAGTQKKSKTSWNENLPSTSSSRSSILAEKESPTQKPTCMVSPLNKKSDCEPIYGLGMTGLDNLGNTCFLNSVLQVLANTKELRDYFFKGVFQNEINHDNPLGTGGKLAVSFATLMKILWSGKYRSYAPAKLKNLIGMKNSQFMGFAQHDAQEFLAYLLDGLHEDVNRVRKKPYTPDVDSDGRPDEVVADEAWARHKSRNDSFIVDLFQGQYKSKLVCPVCGKVSITFDPFMHLSVPLPKKKKMLFPIYYMSRDPYKKPVKYILRLSKDATVNHLKELVYQKTRIHPSNLRVFESYNKIHNFLVNSTLLANFNLTDKIFVCEVLSNKLAGEDVLLLPCVQRTVKPISMPTICSNCKRECGLNDKLKRCTKCMKTAYCNQACQKQDWLRHKPNCIQCNECVGQPFIVSLPKSHATFSRLTQMMEAFSRHSLDVFQPPVMPGQLRQDTSSPSLLSDNISFSATETCTSTQQTSSTDVTTDTDSMSAQCTSTQSSMSHISSSESLGHMSLESQSSQGTSTTEVASSSSDGSFITVESGVEANDAAENDADEIDALVGGNDAAESDPLEENDPVESDSIEIHILDGREEELDAAAILDTTADITLDINDDSSLEAPPTGYVMARQQDMAIAPAFSIRPCTKDGKMISGLAGFKLNDKGDEPLDLSDLQFLAMDWRNHEKCQAYVLVQSKDLDYEEDESITTTSAEESTNITLDQCLSLFTEPEVLSPDHAWYCPSCKEHREATKQLSIWRLPAYLIIQLKRFSFSSFIWRDKIDKLVEYPKRNLDLSAHFIGKIPVNEPPPIYDLYGVVNHMGGILGGHYTSYARCPHQVDYTKNEVGWRLFDDSMVSMSKENQVMTRAGYVLFYRRRNIMMTLPASVEDVASSTTEAESSSPDSDVAFLDDKEVVSSVLSSPTMLAQADTGGGGDTLGDSQQDNRTLISMSNSPSVYSFSDMKFDMDTVD